ncbi:PAS domain-containing protein [Bradyrhizobium sp. CCBAU 21362]|uniref:PAS domain-containing protein n=1 Tax=Bradyrhizobium sp. CCBAU 21362 TaxID=1325082 RepID=UPI003FA47EB3
MVSRILRVVRTGPASNRTVPCRDRQENSSRRRRPRPLVRTRSIAHGTLEGEFRIIRPNGTLRRFCARAEPLPDPTASRNGCLALLPMSRKSKSGLSTRNGALESSGTNRSGARMGRPVVMVTSAFSDPDQSVEYGNPGKSWADLLHDKEREPVLREWQVSLATGQPYEVEARLRQADGAYRCHQCTAVPLGSNGGVRKWLGLWIDAHYNNSRGSGKAHRSSRGGNCEPHVDAELVGEAVGRAKRVIMRRHQAARRVQ